MVLNDLLEMIVDTDIELRTGITKLSAFLRIPESAFDSNNLHDILHDNLKFREVRCISAVNSIITVQLENLRQNYYLTAETKPCCFCGRSTHEYSELYEGYICSEECEEELKKELYEKDIEVE